jgi:hypothetical protein
MSTGNNDLNPFQEEPQKEDHQLSPKDAATASMEMVYGTAYSNNPDALSDDYEDDYPLDLGNSVEDWTSQEDSLIAEEGTPVDPAAPPTEIFHGTDLLNGYSGEDPE